MRRVDNITRRTLKVGEENGELAEAVLSVTSASNNKGKEWIDIVEEAIDVVICALDVALTQPPEWEDISRDAWRNIVGLVAEEKLDKWNRQIGGSTTIIDEELPKFTDEDRQFFKEILTRQR